MVQAMRRTERRMQGERKWEEAACGNLSKTEGEKKEKGLRARGDKTPKRGLPVRSLVIPRREVEGKKRNRNQQGRYRASYGVGKGQ